MRYLVIVSVIWAFSFPLIGHYLVGRNVANPVDSYFVIVARFALALLVFLPFIRFKNVPNMLKALTHWHRGGANRHNVYLLLSVI